MKIKARKIQRGAIRRENCIFIGVWVPTPVVEAVDKAVRVMDLDRSKFFRRALEEKVTKEGK
jgi:hypothetical protein